MPEFHLVILQREYLDKILACQKTVELRLLKAPVPPFGHVSTGDVLFLKRSSGPVCATAQVAAIKELSDLTPHAILKLKNAYNHLICGGADFWKAKSDCKYGSLIWLKNVQQIEPVKITKKDWRAWVVLKKSRDFGLLNLYAQSKLTPSCNVVEQSDSDNIYRKT